MIGVVIPAHNEQQAIGACLKAVQISARSQQLRGEPVHIVVALDRCSDATESVVRRFGVATVAVQARNVGVARSAGAEACLAAGARWLAFTDADTRVSEDWLAAQLKLGTLGADAVCGTVAVRGWGGYGRPMRRRYAAHYRDADGHRHIHGANLGVSAAAYRKAGGFPPLACGEDVALVDALTACGALIAWSAAPRVVTSARRDFRAPGGFGATLMRIDAEPALPAHAAGVGVGCLQTASRERAGACAPMLAPTIRPLPAC